MAQRPLVAGYTNGHGYVVLQHPLPAASSIRSTATAPATRGCMAAGPNRASASIIATEIHAIKVCSTLRCSSPSQNAANMKTRAGKTTPKGVSFIRKTRSSVATDQSSRSVAVPWFVQHGSRRSSQLRQSRSEAVGRVRDRISQSLRQAEPQPASRADPASHSASPPRARPDANSDAGQVNARVVG